jgi:hypothetical protein
VEVVKEKFQDSVKHLKLASHMLGVTYPLVKDPRMFIGILENLNKSLKECLDSFLLYERMYKRISPYPDNFNSKLDVFRNVIRSRYEFDSTLPRFIFEIEQLVKNRKQAPIEFSRKDGFVICDSEYKTRILKIEELKSYISKAKVFILKVHSIITRRTQ